MNAVNAADLHDRFAGKKITLMGLGLLGRGLGDAKFFAAHGADLIVTDLKTEVELAPSVAALKAIAEATSADGHAANITFHLGGHRLEDFENRDLIIRAPNAPLDSPFLARAREHGIPIEMDSALFVKLVREIFGAGAGGSAAAAPPILVGITGTRGKSTTTQLIYEMARAAFADGAAGKNVFLGGNVRDVATLPLIETVTARDVVILELDSWQLQGFEADAVSPQIAVWTNFMPDHMNYYHGDMDRYFTDKAAIARFQRAAGGGRAADIFIAPREIKERVEAKFFAGGKLAATYVNPFAPPVLPADWDVALPGEHNRANAACAVAAGRALGIPDEIIKKTLQDFHGLPNRLEFLGERDGIAFYNDSNATTPDATIAALRALGGTAVMTGAIVPRPIILIAGGNDKQLSFDELAKEISNRAAVGEIKKLILFEGAASEKLKALLLENVREKISLAMAANMPDAVAAARVAAKPGDIILLSPAATSFGIFKNEYDRGEQFAATFAAKK